MKTHQPEVFGTTLEKTNRWVNEIGKICKAHISVGMFY
jgi:hypothetical protein